MKARLNQLKLYLAQGQERTTTNQTEILSHFLFSFSTDKLTLLEEAQSDMKVQIFDTIHKFNLNFFSQRKL